MSLEIYQAIVDTASAVGSLVAVCLAYKAFDVSRNISDHEQDNERTRLTIDVACHAKRKKLTRKTKKTLLNTTFKSVFYYL